MPKLSETQQELRRTRLLDAAEHCFARAGFHATTMQEIARAARVSAGAAYVYFGSKEELIAGIAERDRQRIATDFKAIEEAPDFLAALEHCVRYYLIEQPDHKRTLLVEMSAESTRNPAVARSFRSVDLLVQDVFTRALKRQIAAGRLQPVHKLDRLVPMLMVIGDGMFQRCATDPNFDAARMLPAIMKTIAGMLGTSYTVPSRSAARRPRRRA